MLGLSNAMTSGSHHEQQYSLDLDGDSDYLDIGDNLDFGTNDFVISLWFKADSDSGVLNLLFSKYQDSDYYVEFGINASNKLFMQVKGDGNNVVNHTASTELDALGLTWINVILAIDRSGSGTLYVNGANTTSYGKTASCGSSSQNLDNTGKIYLGARSTSTPSQYFPGKIDEVAIWQAADLSSFDSDAALAVYNSGKPFDLNYDRGDYHHSASLTGYWRMFNGPFDDKQNGAIHDAHNPGFGAEAIQDTNFSVPVAESTTGTYWVTGAGWTISGGGATYDGGGDTNTQLISSITSGFVDSKWHKVEFHLTDTGGGGVFVRICGGSFSSKITGTGQKTVYVLAGSGTNRLTFETGHDDKAFTISNASCRVLNGYPGLTSGTATFSADTPDD